MFGGLWDFLKGKPTLLDDATVDCLMMLQMGREMFRIVTYALENESSRKVREQVAAMDKQVNREQEKVRKKVFEHLAISRKTSLLRGLQLTSIVIDLERIGDYGKNMAELVDVLPAKLDFRNYQAPYDEVQNAVNELFELTGEVLRDNDEKKAKGIINMYDGVSKRCDGTVMELFDTFDEGETINKSDLGLALLMRYMKRVAAHLKNIASTVSNPYHRIGFRPAP